MTQKTTQNPWTMDVRVRERNLKSGALTEKDLEKQLAALPDLSDQVDAFAVSQPALVQQHVAAPAVVSGGASMDHDDLDDEDDLDEDEDEDEVAVAAAPTPVAEPSAPAPVSADESDDEDEDDEDDGAASGEGAP